MLSDEKKREVYDKYGKAGLQEHGEADGAQMRCAPADRAWELARQTHHHCVPATIVATLP